VGGWEKVTAAGEVVEEGGVRDGDFDLEGEGGGRGRERVKAASKWGERRSMRASLVISISMGDFRPPPSAPPPVLL